MHDKFYVIHKIINPKGMVMGDGGFTEGVLFVFFFDKGDATPPKFKPWGSVYMNLTKTEKTA